MIPGPVWRSRFSRAVGPTVAAIVHNWPAFVLVQVVAALVVVAYYLFPSVRAVGDGLAVFKARGGLLFPVVANPIAAVMAPELARRATRVARDRPFTWLDFAYLLAFFGLMGVLVDALYRILGAIYGNEPTVSTVATKTAIDLFVFTPVISSTLGALAFGFRDANFRGGRFVQSMKSGGFMRRWLPILVTGICFWLPVMLAVYSLPVKLQFLMAILAQTGWGLVYQTVAGRGRLAD